MSLNLSSSKIAHLFLFSSLAFTASAQSTGSENAPAIQVLQVKWEKQNRMPGNFDPAVIPTGTTLSAPPTQTIRPGTQAAIDAQRDLAIAAAHPSSQDTGVFGNTAGAPIPVYVYSAKLKNTGPKAIEGIAWDYLFLNPTTKAEVSRRQLLSLTKISPDKTSEIQGTLAARLLLATSPEVQKNHTLVEQAVLQCVLYSDKSTWKNEKAPQAACDFLKRAKEAAKHREGE